MIDIKPYFHALEHCAFKSENTKGRRFIESEEILGVDPFVMDLNRIRNSKAYRRLGNKTQVFSSKIKGPYIRTRLSHTAEVNVNALILSDFLGLNNNLVAAQTEAHDIGHVVMGHLGEKFISKKGGLVFKHNINSSYVLEYLERYDSVFDKNNGLNLSYETHEGINNHSRGNSVFVGLDNTTQETTMSMINDKIGYVPADYLDCRNAGYIDVEPKCFLALGKNQRERIKNCNEALIKESAEKGFVSFNTSKTAEIFMECKDFMYKIYNKIDKKESGFYRKKLSKVYSALQKNKSLASYNPILLFIMMVEEDIDYLVEKSFITQADLESTSLKHVLRNIKAVDKSIPIGTFDINLCCYK